MRKSMGTDLSQAKLSYFDGVKKHFMLFFAQCHVPMCMRRPFYPID